MSDVEYYKSLMRSADTNDYSSGDFLGEQAKSQAHTWTSSKKKVGKPIERSNNDWLGGPSPKRKSYVVKVSSSIPPMSPAAVGKQSYSSAQLSFQSPVAPKERIDRSSFPQGMTMQSSPSPRRHSSDHSKESPVASKERMSRASFSHAMTMLDSPKQQENSSPCHSHPKESPVPSKERMSGGSFSHAMTMLDSPKQQENSSPCHSHPKESPVPSKERMSGGSFSNAFAMFNLQESPTKRNSHEFIRDAKALDLHSKQQEEEEHHVHHEDSGAVCLNEGQSKIVEEALKILQKVFSRLDDCDHSWKQMDSTIQKLRKISKNDLVIKSILEDSIKSLQRIAGSLYEKDQSEIEDAIEYLIDISLEL